jgi:tRNA A37 methylthiotransferase MiaB
LTELAAKSSLEFRQSFVGHTVQVLVEREKAETESLLRHGRCERYFDVHFESDVVATGDLVTLRIERVTPTRTFGTVVGNA